LVVTGDHSTPSRMKSHSFHPVTLLCWAPATVRPDPVTTFGERPCLQGGLGQILAKHIMPLALAHAGRLQKFGAWSGLVEFKASDLHNTAFMGRTLRKAAGASAPYKGPFDIDEAFRRLRKATARLPKAAMFALRDEGFDSPFEQLVGSLISARTRDETTVQICRRLFSVAKTPQEFAALDEAHLVRLLRGASFPEQKARDLLAIAKRIIKEYNGQVPDSVEELTTFRGVGPKIAALTLAVGFQKPAIPVDIHVHRVTNRWGYVSAKTPEQTQAALAAKLPKKYWVEINERLVPFGKFICTGVRPHCSTCLLLSMCAQVAVAQPR
jgi:endonuclease-3